MLGCGEEGLRCHDVGEVQEAVLGIHSLVFCANSSICTKKRIAVLLFLKEGIALLALFAKSNLNSCCLF